MRTVYIYKIENLNTGRVYVGSTVQGPVRRRDEHFSHLRCQKHDNQHLQRSFNKHGEDAFKFEVLTEGIEGHRNELERICLSWFTKVYNQELVFFSGGRSRKHSPEAIEKMRQAQVGRPINWDAINKSAAARRGKKQLRSSVRKRALNNPCRRPVINLSTGVEYESAPEAARQLGIDGSSISKACRGKLKTTGGFRWSYKQHLEKTA